MRTSIAVVSAALFVTLASDRATGQESVRLKGLNGGVATVTRASKDGTLLIGTSRTELPWSLTVTTWAAPDWQPRVVPTPENLDYAFVQGVSDNGGVVAANSWYMDVHIWWDGLTVPATTYAGEGQWFSVDGVSSSGNAAFGWMFTTDSNIMPCLYTKDGIRFPIPAAADPSPLLTCISSDGASFAGAVIVGTTDPNGRDIYRCDIAAWVRGIPEVLPLPDAFDFARPTVISDAGTRVRGFAQNRVSDGLTLTPEVGIEWNRDSSGRWSVAVTPERFDEPWGVMRADGRRRLGVASGRDGVTLRDTFHGDRRFHEVVQQLFPETGDSSVYPVTCAMGDGRVAVWNSSGSWIITLPSLADVNEDGVLDIADTMMFVDALVAGESRADWNLDGELTFEDFDAFVADYENGTR